MLGLLRLPNIRLFLLGQTLSLFGDTALYLALGIWVKSLTGSNAAAGLVFFALAVPSLAAPAAGLLVDRAPRRPLMIALDLLAGVSVVLLLLVHSRDQLWIIYTVTVLYGAVGAIFAAAQSAMLTTILPSELLGAGNAALQTVRESLRIVGPLTGAGLFAAFGGGAVAAIDAATFGVSAICLAAMQVPKAVQTSGDKEGAPQFFAELSAGVRHIVRPSTLRDIILTTAVALLAIGFSETLIFAVVSQGLQRQPSFLGVLSALQGVGAIAGGLTVTRVMHRLGDARTVALGLALFGIGYIPLASSSLVVVMLGFVIAGAGLPWVVVGFGTAIQQRTPAGLQGRAYSAANAIVSAPQTLSIALGAALSTVVDYRFLVGIVASVTVSCAAFLVTRPAQPLAVVGDGQ
jgi:MFS family permease